ncbi:acyl-CoA dehydrogenase [Lewinella sp. JB7]|uniref:acyl-CoA dehydrogenase family protein n=1 Tax=Lewinella sp. JB7 TaxID=2962887 RepID=UPI0020C9A05C|nr:acyl-CoA dehydrogenase [Lewinella sp. JB7]MCP9234913.1 acyl-CoA dehydrogenase family protein [Lewinella sp. JB7]
MGADLQTNTYLSPGIQAMLPFLYAAWSDRHLSVPEIESLRREAAQLPFLTEDDRRVLSDWSDPVHPPSRERFQQWLTNTRRAAEALPTDRTASLAELGTWLGQAAESDPEARADYWREQLPALLQIEQGLGGVREDTYRSLFPRYDEREKLNEAIRESSVDPAHLQQILEGPHAEVIRRVKEILLRPSFERTILRIKEDYREQVLRWCKELAREGIGALSYPREYGGQGSMQDYAAAFETIAYHDLSLTIKFGVQFGLWGGAIYNLGTKRHHEAYLRETGTLELPGCFAMTETGHGSNVRGLETTAVYDHENRELIVHTPSITAGKEYIGNAMHSRMAAVFCQLIVDGESHGVHAVVVPIRDEAGHTLAGIRVEDNGYKLGLNGVDNGRLWFDQVRVPVDNLLDKYGGISAEGNYESPIESPSRRFFTMLGTLVGGRVFVPRAGLSAAKSALTIAVRYGLRRRQFPGESLRSETIILDYPNQQRRLLPLVAKAYAVQFGLDHLLDRYVNRTEEQMREIEAMAAGLKSYATWFATAAIQEGREATGGKGYLAENRFADLKADTDIFTTFEGDNTVLMQLLAKSLLTEFNKSFQEDGNIAVLKYLGRRVTTIVTEQNPYVVRQTDREHLESRSFYQSAFHFRARRLVSTLAQRLRAYIKDGKSAYEAGLLCQTHMIAAAEAYVEQLVLDESLRRVDGLDGARHPSEGSEPSNGAAQLLEKVITLYAAHTIEGHAAWYLESGYISGPKSKAIRKLVDILCAELRPEAGVLVDGFGIPDELLGAPIALA